MDSGTVVKSCKQDSCGPQAAEFHSKIHVPRRRRISSDQLLPVVLPGLTSLCRNLFAFSLSLLSSGTQSLWFLDTCTTIPQTGIDGTDTEKRRDNASRNLWLRRYVATKSNRGDTE